MLLKLNLFLFLLISSTNGFSYKNIYPKPNKVTHKAIAEEALILTPLINSRQFERAKDLSRVTNLTDVVSYSGYLTVDEKHNSNLFFWFFPAAFNPENAPVLLWLQGGPGGSSLFGLFVENGPFIIDKDNNINLRETSWSLTHSVIFIDNPCGTGYSYCDDDGYAKNEEDVANNLYNALSQFFTLFSEYQPRDFYATGESYAGKYVPAISYKIHTENQKQPKLKINLKGMAIGDGYSDPISMLNYGGYLYSIGLLDYNGKLHFDQEENKAKEFLLKGDTVSAWAVIDALLDGDMIGVPSYFTNATGFVNYFNFMVPFPPPDQNYYSSFVQLDYVRRSMHVGNNKYSEGTKVERNLKGDMFISVKNWIEELLNSNMYKILMYSGQLDIIVANTLTDNFIRSLKWDGAEDLSNAQRKIWRVGSDIAGYAKSARNFTHLLVRNAGHMIPYDQPKWAFDMINRFTRGKSY